MLGFKKIVISVATSVGGGMFGGAASIILGAPFGVGALAGAAVSFLVTLNGLGTEETASVKPSLAKGAALSRLLAFDTAGLVYGLQAQYSTSEALTAVKGFVGSAANMVVILSAPFNAVEHFAEAKKLWEEGKRNAAYQQLLKGTIISGVGISVLLIEGGIITAHESIPAFLGILAAVFSESKLLVAPEHPTLGLSLGAFCVTFGAGLLSKNPIPYYLSSVFSSIAASAIEFSETAPAKLVDEKLQQWGTAFKKMLCDRTETVVGSDGARAPLIAMVTTPTH